MKDSKTLYTEIVAVAEGRPISELTGADLARYFISNGIDYKGQSQVGIIGSGYGVDFKIEFQGGIASLDAGTGLSRLKKSVLLLQRGPRALSNEPIAAPISLFTMIGAEWKSTTAIEAFVGLKAEAQVGLGSTGATKDASHNLQKSDDDEATAEYLSASASASVGLKAGVNVTLDHYWGYDPAPTYYLTDKAGSILKRGDLEKTLGDMLKDDTLKRTLKREAQNLINELRDYIMKDDKLRPDEGWYKENVGVYFFSLTGDKKLDDETMASEKFVSSLTKMANPNNYIRKAPETSSWLGREDWPARAAELVRRFQPFLKDPKANATSWLRMRSARFSGEAAITATAEVKGAAAMSGAVTAEASVAAVAMGGNYCRTGIKLQTQLTQGTTPLMCTQDTVVTYAKFEAEALTAGVKLEAKSRVGTASASADACVVSRTLNLMNYESANLYWKKGSGATAQALKGSGVIFGQSFIVKNLRSAIAKTSPDAQTKWIVRMAERLKISTNTLCAFLKSEPVTSLLASFAMRSQNTTKKEDQPWDDRAVLVEAAFALKSSPQVVLADGTPKDLLVALVARPSEEKVLKSLRIRYRISDFRSSTNTWSLGFKLPVVGGGVSFRSLSEAGSEGIVDLHTVWFDASGNVRAETGLTVYEEEDSVPPVTLFCQ